MKTNHLAVMTLLVIPVVAHADESPVDLSVDVPFFSKYVWRGVNLINDPVLQPSFNVSFEGWNLNLWGNYDIDNSKRFNEFDTTLSYTGMLSQGAWTVGYVDYAFPGSGIAHTREFFGNFSFNHDWSPYVQLNFDVDEIDGLYARVGASKSVETTAGEIDFHGWFGYGDTNMNNALYGNNKSGLADFGIEATWSKSLSENATGYVKLGYTTLLDSKHLQGQSNRNNFIFGFGVGFGL